MRVQEFSQQFISNAVTSNFQIKINYSNQYLSNHYQRNMKSIFEIIIAVLWVSICMLSAQISAVSWTTYNPFYLVIPYFEYQTETARQHQEARIAADTSFALIDSAGRSFIDKIAKLNLKGQLKGIRRALEQLAAQREMDLNEIQMKLNEKATKFDLENLKTTVGEIDSNLMTLTQKFEKETAVVEIGHMPESCTDLKTIGYKMNGIFQIIGKKQIETVYCNFTSTNAEDLQKWIGYADIKSAPTYFYVQKNDHSGTTGIPIPFENEIINTEKAMDLTVGKFTAPRPGIYFFSFTGLPDFTASTSVVYFEVSLYLNGERIASGRVEDSNTVLFQRSPLTVQSTLNLKKDDQVWMEINDMSTGIQLHDSGGHYTHFTGFLLEEEIVASL